MDEYYVTKSTSNVIESLDMRICLKATTNKMLRVSSNCSHIFAALRSDRGELLYPTECIDHVQHKSIETWNGNFHRIKSETKTPFQPLYLYQFTSICQNANSDVILTGNSNVYHQQCDSNNEHLKHRCTSNKSNAISGNAFDLRRSWNVHLCHQLNFHRQIIDYCFCSHHKIYLQIQLFYTSSIHSC